MPNLEPTGERTVPGVDDEAYWFARHRVVYTWVRDLLGDGARVVVDAGAGEGYGIDLLAEPRDRLAVGLELDAAVAHHAAVRYPRVRVVRANLAGLPLRSESCDAVVCLQVIEHLWSLRDFLADCHRVLHPGGLLIVSTPNRPVFSPGLGRGERPTNPFHVEEFDAEQVRAMLADAGFAAVDVVGVHHGARLVRWEAQHGSLVDAQIDAVLSGAWPESLREFVGSITDADFAVLPTTVACHDLVAVARR